MSSKVMYSKQSAHVATGDGMSRFIGAGEAVRADDPIVAMYPSMFTEDGTAFVRNPGPVSNTAMETASADPGERRSTKARHGTE